LLADFGEVSTLAKARLQKGDVILTANGTKVPDVATLLRNDPTLLPGQALHFTFSAQQRELTVTLTP
jgi:S1-C subfamily serine protease